MARMLMTLIFLLVVPILVQAVDLKQEYFTDAIFPCNHSNHNWTNDSPIRNKYWLLPNGTAVGSNYTGSHVVVDSDFSITINHIDDSDFGYYLCLLIRSDYSVDTIRHGLNVDGPYFGDLLAIYSKKAMIGGIAGGSLFIVLMAICLVWQLRYQKRNRKNKAVDDLDKAIDGFDLKTYNNVGMDLEDDLGKVTLEPKAESDGVANGDGPIVESDRF